MPTSPFTPITKDSIIWTPAVKALLTDGMIALINKSPTLRAQLNQLGDEIGSSTPVAKKIDLINTSTADAPTGSNYVARDNILLIHPSDMQLGAATFNADARFVGILAHEMGHRIDDTNLDNAASTFFGKVGQDERYASIMVHSEGVAAANAYIVRKEILQTGENNSGPEIYFPGARYNASDDVLKGLIRLDNTTASWDAPTRLEVFSDVGANYLAVANPGTDPSNAYWPYYLNNSRAARGLPPAPAPQAGSVELG